MYRTVPPVLDPASRTLPLRLTRVVRREFTGGTCVTDDPALRRYFADLAHLHDIDDRPGVLAGAGGNTFGTLADAALAGCVSPLRPVDLVVIAHTLPDLDPRYSAGVRLTRTLPGSPLVFAISGKDASIGFTALGVAAAYTRRHAYRRVVVLVLDQSLLPYETPARPARDAAVALFLEDAPGSEVTLGQVADVPPGDVDGVLALLAGTARVVRADRTPDAPGTGVWTGLTPGTDAVLADYDEARGEVRYCALREP